MDDGWMDVVSECFKNCRLQVPYFENIWGQVAICGILASS